MSQTYSNNFKISSHTRKPLIKPTNPEYKNWKPNWTTASSKKNNTNNEFPNLKNKSKQSTCLSINSNKTKSYSLRTKTNSSPNYIKKPPPFKTWETSFSKPSKPKLSTHRWYKTCKNNFNGSMINRPDISKP